MERRNFTRELKLEAVKLVKERGVEVAQAPRAKIGANGNAEAPAHISRNTQARARRAESAVFARKVIYGTYGALPI
jgi:transposase-like protein